MQAYLRRHEDDQQVRELIKSLGDRLQARFSQFATKDWRWHEAELNYDNARLPEALMACGRVTNDDDMVKTGIGVLEWLRDIQLDPVWRMVRPGWQSGLVPQIRQQGTIRSTAS